MKNDSYCPCIFPLNFLQFHAYTKFTENKFMYAVIKTGGKQYKVAQGHTLKIEKLFAEVGTSVDFDKVLLVDDGKQIKIGSPVVDGGKVTATVEAHGRGKKVQIIKFKRRKHHRKQMGHRQHYTEIKITGIMADGIEAPIVSSNENSEVAQNGA